MQEPSLQKVISAFAHLPDSLYFVGGCVRNSLLSQPVDDIDIAVSLPPEQVEACLRAADICFKSVGRAFGTILAIVDNQSYEITSFRKDIETDGRWAKVSYTDNLLEDAIRRDFTMNALYLTPSGDLYDPCHGLKDLRQGYLRFIGNPTARILEDHLRILRFFRFYAWYGKTPSDEAALQACGELAVHLKKISAERIREELLKLLRAPAPLESLKLMAKAQVTESFIGLSLNMRDFEKLVQVEASLEINVSPLLRLYVLLGCEIFDYVNRFAFSNQQMAYLKKLSLFSKHAQQSSHEWLYYKGAEIAQAYIVLKRMSSDVYQTYKVDWQKTLNWQKPVFPLTGHDALKLGLQGSTIKQVLQAVEKWWVKSNFQPSHDECLMQLRTFIQEISIQ